MSEIVNLSYIRNDGVLLYGVVCLFRSWYYNDWCGFELGDVERVHSDAPMFSSGSAVHILE